MTFTSYAQNFEDVMLWRALSHIERGFYIDIGAQDPIIDSVSLAFHERGWRGIHVEPIQQYAELLRQQRPGDLVIQAAVGSGPSLLHFFETPGGGISTADPDIAEQHRQRGIYLNEITVPCVALSAVFEACVPGEIHWLKIDVEGYERQVLLSWGSSPARPWIVVVESTLPLTQIAVHDKWETLLIEYGYNFAYFDGLNRYYISGLHPELKTAFQSPPNVFDGFALNGTASADFHKVIESRSQRRIDQALAQLDLQKRSADSEVERLTLSIAAQEQAHVAREQLLSQELQSVQEESRKQQRDWADRELASSEKAGRVRERLQRRLSSLAGREQELRARLLDEFSAAREQHSHALALSEAGLREVAARLAERDALASEQSDRLQQLEKQLIDARKNAIELDRNRSALRAELATARDRVVTAEAGAVSSMRRLHDVHHALAVANETLREVREQLADQERLYAERMVEIQEITQQVSVQSLQHAEREGFLRAELAALRDLLAHREAQAADREGGLRAALESAKAAALRDSHAHENRRTVLEQVLADTRELLSEREQEIFLKSTEIADVRNTQSLQITVLEEQQAALRAVESSLRTSLAAQTSELDGIRRQLKHMQTSLPLRLSSQLRRWVSGASSDPDGRISAYSGEVPTRNLPSAAPDIAADEREGTGASIDIRYRTLNKESEFKEQHYMAPIHHVNQLFGLRGAAFVAAAYEVILGREPDSQGGAYYEGRLQAEQDRAQILYELTISKEGRDRPQSLPGLTELIESKRQSRMSGRRWLRKLVGIDATSVRLEAMVASLGEEFNGRFRSIESQLALLADTSGRSLATVNLAIAASHGTLEASLKAISTTLKELQSEMTAVPSPVSRKFPQALDCTLAANSGSEALIHSLAQQLAASAQAHTLSKK
jgi:FkbM family methyltransferase